MALILMTRRLTIIWRHAAFEWRFAEMNTCGWIRGYLTKWKSLREFVEMVVGTLALEFECDGSVELIGDDYVIKLGNYEVKLSRDICQAAQSDGVYKLDRLILGELEKTGLAYERTRSQYIRYCHGIFFRRLDGTVG
jgi:hypothetical protein